MVVCHRLERADRKSAREEGVDHGHGQEDRDYDDMRYFSSILPALVIEMPYTAQETGFPVV